MKISARSSVLAGLVGLAITGIWYSGAGCSSNSDNGSGGSTTSTGGIKTSTGGATATGGGTATGGTTSTGGKTGTGGGTATGGATTSTGGATAATGGTSGACTMGTAPASKDITNFDGATMGATLPSIGVANGYLYTFSTGAPITISLTGTATSQSLTFKETSVATTAYDGVGISFPSCYDVSAYTGVKFTLSAVTVTGCDFTFGLDFAEDAPPTTSDARGTCTTAPCYGPTTAITATTAMVPFTLLKTGGMPKDTNLKTVTGIKWQVHPTAVAAGDGGTAAAACKDVAFTIDDVAFY